MDNETKEVLDLILKNLNELNISIIKINNSLKTIKNGKGDNLFL